jgi:hypothetical protein
MDRDVTAASAATIARKLIDRLAAHEPQLRLAA